MRPLRGIFTGLFLLEHIPFSSNRGNALDYCFCRNSGRKTAHTFGSIALSACISAASAQTSGWKPVEKIETYAISGSSGAELYHSIGENGPKIRGDVRTIAYTDFKLTWTRDYRAQADGACVLVSARPKLVITYRLPRPRAKLPPGTAESWERFITGIEAHERVHGDIIVEMVKAIEAMSVGFRTPDDRGCRKIREELTKKLAQLSQTQRQRSRDFDRVEMGDGGNIQQLILRLVNGM